MRSLGLTDQSPNQTVKRLSRVLDDRALVTPELMRLTRWMADYYLCGWGQVLNAVIPDRAKGTTGFGFTGFKDANMDKAIEQGRNPTNGDCSTAARKAQYETFNKVLNDNQPYNFGYSNNVLVGSQKTLQNFDPASFSQIWNVHTWWIKQ